MSRITNPRDGCWRWCGLIDGCKWQAEATVDLMAMTVSFVQEPVDGYMQRHEGGGATYSIMRLRSGDARGWSRSQPALYAAVLAHLDAHLPE